MSHTRNVCFKRKFPLSDLVCTSDIDAFICSHLNSADKLARCIPFTKPFKRSCILFAVVMMIKVFFKVISLTQNHNVLQLFHKMHNVLQLFTVEPTMPPQPDITEDSHQEVNTEHKILSTCPSSVLGLMTKETGKGVSYHKFTGICWMTNTLSENTQPGLYEMPSCCDRY